MTMPFAEAAANHKEIRRKANFEENTPPLSLLRIIDLALD
jgi:hypothetical protein